MRRSRAANKALRARRWDVVIAGAGPAGLSAALVLGRSRRRVLLCDTGTPRSWATKRMHSFLTRDGVAPDTFRRAAHRDLQRYPNVVCCPMEVTSARRLSNGFFDVLVGGTHHARARKMLIATGVLDELPPIAGIEHFFGKTVFTCPYCDGWEWRDAAIAVYGRRHRGFEMARALTGWSDDIALCTNGRSGLSQADQRSLTRNGIRIFQEPIARLKGSRGRLDAIVFRSGRVLPRSVLFFDTPSHAQSTLAQSLGCQFTRNGGVRCGQYEATSVPGVFVAGNIIRDVQLAIVAAAEGTRAAFGINRALTREDFERRATGVRRIQHTF
ncbi:MAG: NAD(P)/FAD-dependent oxidoreductase [Steroidobacteraceae bacterium]|nr:NAD(P)/FAD-dependent oxidoreductase [Steroidobacteraceae bacterium]